MEESNVLSSLNMNNLFSEIIDDVRHLDFFSDYKFRKRDSTLYLKTKQGKQSIELDHWIDSSTASLVIYPIYGVRFDILSKWFEKFSVKQLQTQRDRTSIDFTGNMLSQQDKFVFKLNKDGFHENLENFKIILKRCSEYVFSTYSSLDNLYEKTIQPILDGDATLPDVGADWIFIDLALCKLVEPDRFYDLKQIVLSQVDKMYQRREPNIMDYYDRLEEILHYLEYNKI